MSMTGNGLDGYLSSSAGLDQIRLEQIRLDRRVRPEP